MHTESYIDHSIPDPKGLPSYVQDLLNCLHEYDQKGQYGIYDAELDNLCVLVKNAIADGQMTHDDWKTICKKYWEHEEIVLRKELADEDL